MACVTQRGVVLRDPTTPGQMAGVNDRGELNVAGPIVSAWSSALVHSVGTTQVAILAANSDRKWAMIQNHDASELLIRFADGGDAIYVLPQYGMLELCGQILYTGAVWAIRAAATGNAGVLEA